MTIKSHTELIVWQKSVTLAETIYKETEKFPKNELFGLTSQMRRSCVSIASNIAEGRNRGTRKDFAQFLKISLGSVAELQTQSEIAFRVKFLNKDAYEKINNSTEEIGKMLRSMIRKLLAKSSEL